MYCTKHLTLAGVLKKNWNVYWDEESSYWIFNKKCFSPFTISH